MEGEQNQGLSLEVIREAMPGVLQGAMSEVRQDIQSFSARVDNVEAQVTKQKQQTINLFDEMTNKYSEYWGIMQQLQEANREVRIRLERLQKGRGPPATAGSTVAPSTEAGAQTGFDIFKTQRLPE